jgi:predicted transposase/invertase (TIGR01784 family)
MNVPPTHDLMFSCIFRDMGAADAALSLINAIFRDKGKAPFAGITSLESQYSLVGHTATDKVGRLDALAQTQDGTLCSLEMQVKDLGDMDKRMAFYAGRLMSGGTERGGKYVEQPNVGVIVIEGAGYEPNPDGRYHHSYSMRDDEPPHGTLKDWPEVHKLSLATFARQKQYDKTNLLNLWLKMFVDGYNNRDFIKEAGKMDAGLTQFAERYNIALGDPDFMKKVRYIESAEYDYAMGMRTAEKRGEAKGRAEGEAKGRAEGRAEGEAKGRAEGRAEGREQYLRSAAAVYNTTASWPVVLTSFPGLTDDEQARVRGMAQNARGQGGAQPPRRR